MSQPSIPNEQSRQHAIHLLSEKILKTTGFSREQSVSWDKRGEKATGHVWEGSLEVREEGSPPGSEYPLRLDDLPLVELLNKSQEETFPFPVGTVLTCEINKPPPQEKKTIKRVVTALLVTVVDFRLRPYYLLPHELQE